MERLVDPLTTTDAKLWADEFMKVKARLGEQKFDHAMMLGWFANAIMQGYDEGRRRAKADAQATVEALQARVQELEARQHFGACAKCLTNAWRICKEGTPDAVEMKCSNGSTWWLCDYCLSKEQLTQRTAEVTQLQALVRALPVLPESDLHLDEVWARLKRGNIGIDLVLNLLRYRATLGATTPAPDTSIIGKCEPPSQWDPNAQVRGDIS